MSVAPDNLTEALRRLPVPEPTPDFAARVLSRAVTATEGAGADSATAAASHVRLRWLSPGTWRWWSGALVGAAAAAVLVVMRPVVPAPTGVPLVVDESREIMVLIDSERVLEDAVISIRVTGNLALTGYESERDLQWRATLERGSNVVAVPVTARGAGPGRIVAEIEHGGRVRSVAVDVVAEPSTADGETVVPGAAPGQA